MIQEINLEADILESTYCDKMTVYRPFKDTLPETGESVFLDGLEGKVIYENVKCALSSASGGKANKNNETVKVESDYKLFYRPELRIEKNDTVKVIHQEMTYMLTAGKEIRLGSHNELAVNDQEDKA